MFAFWKWLLERTIEAADPRVIVEVGAGTGRNTRNLVAYAASHDCVLHVVDPTPGFDVDEWRAEHPQLVFHRERSVDALAGIADVDVALLDGDHNWFTVHRELELLGDAAASAGRAFPLVFVGDVSWPYARRDNYADPASIPAEHLHPHRKAGIVFGERELSDGHGINGGLFNAEDEGTPRNGVLTAVEDYVAETGSALDLRLVPGYSGLGVLAPRARLEEQPQLRAAFDRLTAPDFLVQHAKRLERVHTVLHMSFVEQKRELREANARVKALEGELAAGPPAAAAPRPAAAAPEPSRPAVHHPLGLTIAFVGSERVATLLAPSCEAVMPAPQDWQGASPRAVPDLLLVETPGEGERSPWSPEALTDPAGPLAELLKLCRDNGVPSALWATVDHSSIRPYFELAPAFDHRFVADPESAIVMARALPSQAPPSVLPWAFQPALYSMAEGFEHDGRPLYIGGWGADWPAASQSALGTLLDAALPHGLRIAVPAGEHAEFPPEYAGAIEEAGIDLAREVELMRRAPLVIAFHPAIDARTYVARSAFEAVACGAAVIGRPNWGMNHYFGDTTARAGGVAEAKEQFALLLSDEAARRERVQTAQGFLIRAHTYDHRLATIASTLGRRLVPQPGELRLA